jgi:hypothetical protein
MILSRWLRMQDILLIRLKVVESQIREKQLLLGILTMESHIIMPLSGVILEQRKFLTIELRNSKAIKTNSRKL